MPADELYGKHAKHAKQGNLPHVEPAYEGGYSNQKWNTVNNTWSTESQIDPTYSDGNDYRYKRSNYGKKRQKSHLGRKIAAVIALLLVAFLGSLGITGGMMYAQMDDLRMQASMLEDGLLRGNPSEANTAAREIAAITKNLDSLTSGPQWKLASLLPYIGNTIDTVCATTEVANSLCSELLLPIAQKMDERETGPILSNNNRFNSAAIQAILETLSASQSTISTCKSRIEQLSSCNIKQVDSLRTKLHTLMGALDTCAEASPGLESNISHLLGADGSIRSYLLVALSSSEVRSIGGLPGSYGILTIDNGLLSVGDFLALKDTPRYVPTSQENDDTETIAPGLTNEEQVLFGRRVVNVPAETAVNPQFSRFAESFSYLYSYRGHGETDGVIAIDTEFLSAILSVIGSVTTSDGTLIDSKNASRLLLHDAYSTKTTDEQDLFFAEVAETCFNQLFTNTNTKKLAQLAKKVWRTSNTRHFQIWIPDNQVERSLETLGFAGEISQDEQYPCLGVYINDDTWSKITWYLSVNTSIKPLGTNPDGSKTYQVSTKLTNHLSEDEAWQQPDYVIGTNWRKRSRADMLNWIFVYAPADGTITNLETDAYFTPVDKTRSGFNGIEETAGMNRATHLNHEVWFGQIQLDAGEVATINYTVTTSTADKSTNLALDQSPTAQKAAGW